MKKKSQAAMEFLMTYGWAIMVVLVAISALAYFGVLDSKIAWKFLPKLCQLPAEMYCSDFEIYYDESTLPPSNTLKIYVKNNRGIKINIDRVQIANIDDPSIDIDLANGEDRLLEVTEITPLNGNTEGILPGNAYKLDFTITYKNTETGLEHTAKATLRGQQVLETS
ncbi:MAG: hypothetical protein WCW64_00760 [Phycisphaerae bacterium]|jgi:hypothetical protein